MLVNAVFEGGGVKGISLAGAIKAAEEFGVTFHRVAGTSSGSIVAALLAAGYSADEMKEIIIQTPFSSFLKRAPIFNIKFIGPAVRVLLKKGLYSGEVLEYWIHSILRAKNIRTFGDLGPRKLQIIASDISNGRLLVLPDDIANYGIDPPKFEIAKAVRMSTSIPYFFDPVMIRNSSTNQIGRKKSFTNQFSYIVDGGLLSNFPLWLFENERNPRTQQMIPTVGFQMVGKHENQPHPIQGLFTMFEAMFETMMSAHDERYIEQYNRYRTIKIPTLGIRNTQFDISTEQSLQLFDSGYLAGRKFFEQWSYQQYESQYKKYQIQLPVK
ncbi:patatin [Paenibacillus selenitireducens]|uniref:Patatin n=1 Tax=Paenibacillus selenitireducens TaxID=1324314 RepID=A0A1T2XN72_9BACL|nr:patatin-like phospholipase family protein [Paenibacillus selenitireducens]OPA81320.1 patatin [Paenibacillus selenitireducens]